MISNGQQKTVESYNSVAGKFKKLILNKLNNNAF